MKSSYPLSTKWFFITFFSEHLLHNISNLMVIKAHMLFLEVFYSCHKYSFFRFHKTLGVEIN